MLSRPTIALFAFLAILLAGCSAVPPPPPQMGGGVAIVAATEEMPQLSGIGQPDDGTCGTETPDGTAADYSYMVGGELEGCMYVFIDAFECGPTGIYVETGKELFVGTLDGNSGTFETNYEFLGRFSDCENLGGQVSGGCYHAIIAGSGEEAFDGVIGRLVFVDDVEAGNFPYIANVDFR